MSLCWFSLYRVWCSPKKGGDHALMSPSPHPFHTAHTKIICICKLIFNFAINTIHTVLPSRYLHSLQCTSTSKQCQAEDGKLETLLTIILPAIYLWSATRPPSPNSMIVWNMQPLSRYANGSGDRIVQCSTKYISSVYQHENKVCKSHVH